MKHYLIDTHILLWLFAEPAKISERAKIIIANGENNLSVSLISFWEIAIKASIGKLDFRTSIAELQELTNQRNIGLIIPDLKAIETIKQMPFYKHNGIEHRDPFDRMLIAQAVCENLPIISADTKFDLYPEIQRVW